MDPYNPAKYVLRAPPPIPPRPGSVAGNAGDEALAPPLPPRLPSSTAVPTFPPPPTRPAQQLQPSPVAYQPAYNPGYIPPPPTQPTYSQASHQPQLQSAPPQQPSFPPPQTAYQPPPYHPPVTSASPNPPSGIPQRPPEYGDPAVDQQYESHQQPAQPTSYQQHPTYPPPPTQPGSIASVGPAAGQRIPIQPSAPQPPQVPQSYPLSTASSASPPSSSQRASFWDSVPPTTPSYGPPTSKSTPQDGSSWDSVGDNAYRHAIEVEQQQRASIPSSYHPPVEQTYQQPSLNPAAEEQSASGGSGRYDRGAVQKEPTPQASSYLPPPTAPSYAPPLNRLEQDYASPPPPAAATGTHGSEVPQQQLCQERAHPVVRPSQSSYEPIQLPPIHDPTPVAQPQAPSGQFVRMEALTQTLSNTHLNERREQTVQSRPKSPPRPAMQFDPRPNLTLRKCPSTAYFITTPSPWYIHPSVPDFTICTHCYNKHIAPTRFANSFNRITIPGGAKPECLFSCPRIEDSIWPRALQADGNLDELVQFFSHRLRIPHCTKQRGVAASEGIKWYCPPGARQSWDFLACQACYEDVLLRSLQLGGGFMLFTGAQPKETLFVCDMQNAFVRTLAGKTESMGTFMSEAVRHLQLPECQKNGEMVPGSSRKWFHPRDAPEITVCGRCYGEYAVRSEFENNFLPVTRPAAQLRCLLGMWQTRSVWDEALATHDFNLWVRTMLEVNRTPLCTLEIPPGTAVYQLPGVDNFDICHSCFIGLLKPHGLDRFFRRDPAPCNGQRACDLNPGSARFPSYAYKLDEALITATFSPFANLAARLSMLELCPKLNPTPNRSWYGTETCRICPSCYEEVVRDTFLAQSTFPPTPPPPRLEPPTTCDLYSPRMRAKFQSACAARDASPFLAFASHRREIYAQTVPEMRHLVAKAQHSLKMQKMYNITSSAYNNMDGISQVGMYDSGWRYSGAGVPGSFRTHWGVEGAAMGQTAMGYMHSIQVDAARVRYLQGVWDAVE